MDEMKAEETVTIDLSDKSSIGEVMVVATGRSNVHLASIADRVVKDLKAQGITGIGVEGLRHGLINTVATDHAPFDFEKQKPMGRDDFTKIPNGIPSLEERVNLLYTHGVATGRIDLHTFVNVASTT
eukprot:gene16390-biopygen13963